MTPLLEYIDAWVANDAERIAAAVAPESVVIECYGPVYRGRERVREWASAWFTAGGIVHRWTVVDHFIADDREAAQWVFECTWEGNRSSFDGATISSCANGLVVELREFQTTAPLYEWNGTWR